MKKAQKEMYSIMQTEKIDVIQHKKAIENMSPPIVHKQVDETTAFGGIIVKAS